MGRLKMVGVEERNEFVAVTGELLKCRGMRKKTSDGDCCFPRLIGAHMLALEILDSRIASCYDIWFQHRLGDFIRKVEYRSGLISHVIISQNFRTGRRR